jgi:hypothetical protein
MNKTYRTERGSCIIIIKRISDAATKMATKLMVYKLIRKCLKEEVPAGVVAIVSQCANGTMINWAPYLLNFFLDDCKDVQDLGTKFHYSWLMILIDLIIWKDSSYSYFYDRVFWCHVEWYTSMGSTLDPKKRSVNAGNFAWYVDEI